MTIEEVIDIVMSLCGVTYIKLDIIHWWNAKTDKLITNYEITTPNRVTPGLSWEDCLKKLGWKEPEPMDEIQAMAEGVLLMSGLKRAETLISSRNRYRLIYIDRDYIDKDPNAELVFCGDTWEKTVNEVSKYVRRMLK